MTFYISCGLHILDQRQTEVIRRKLQMCSIYRIDWRDYMLRMSEYCSAKSTWNYKLRAHFAVGRPGKRWQEQILWSLNGSKQT